MKKILAAVLALIMILGCTSVYADDMVELYKSDFTKAQCDGWYGNCAPYKVTDEGDFFMYSRSQGWNAPKREFKLQPGVEYKVTVEIYQESMDTVPFMMSVEQDGANWVNLITDVQVPKGEWTTMEGTFTLEKFKKYELDVETTDEFAKVDFKIRNFTIYGPKGAL